MCVCARCGRVVTALEEAQGLLSRFDSVYLGYITQGGAGVALVGCYEPTCQMLLFPYTLVSSCVGTAVCRSCSNGLGIRELYGTKRKRRSETGRMAESSSAKVSLMIVVK